MTYSQPWGKESRGALSNAMRVPPKQRTPDRKGGKVVFVNVINVTNVQPVNPSQDIIKAQFRALAERLCETHPAISTNPRVLGGAPHINGLRLSVAHILAHIYHLGSIDAVVSEFKQRVSKEQVKQALAYAHDFMEMACDPSEDDD
jgi:uncharacterized protein (DUF433 family)